MKSVTIGASFSVSAAWLKRLTAYSKQPQIAVQYFETEDLALKETGMYIMGNVDGAIYVEGVLGVYFAEGLAYNDG